MPPPLSPPLSNMAPQMLQMPVFAPQGLMDPQRGALPLYGLTVLLVEDSRFASDALRMMCRRSGARLRRAETLDSARAHLRTYRPDVVIVDLGLPDGRGDALIRELAMARHGGVILGTSGDSDGRKAALAAGAQGFLEKPLPGLVAFQRAVLRHLPGQFALLPAEPGEVGLAADDLALMDDLTHAADLIAIGPDGRQRQYLAGFVRGLARQSGDARLTEAAAQIANPEATLAPVCALLRGLIDDAKVRQFVG